MSGTWYPVLRSEEAAPRHLAQTALFGAEMVIWRDDDGAVNVWPNRCPHRSVRLSIGVHLGNALRCRYHGFSFETGTGSCTHIPAHPNRTPAAAIGLAPYPVFEKYGYVWSALEEPDGEPEVPDLNETQTTTLRSVFFRVAAADLTDALADWASNEEVSPVTLPQPVDESSCFIHAVLPIALEGANRIVALRRFDAVLTSLRKRVEAR